MELLAQRKKKNHWNEKDRLREFRHGTKYSCIFICNCCHRRLFHENVEVITEKLINDFNRAKEGLYSKCIDQNIETPINGRTDCYICKTCILHLKAQRMPPMSVQNKLKLDELQEDMILTDMEGSLIAKNLLFAKIYQLPKSRWTALTDKMINVPIANEDVKNTVALLPRTPKEAQLVGISFKRKLEYKNAHISQLVNPCKIKRMLALLTASGNPYYQFNIDVENFQERCKIEDPEGYQIIFTDDSEVDQIRDITDKIEYNEILPTENEMSSKKAKDDEEICAELEDEIEYLANDPIRKYQFTYDESVCMANKYPEIEAVDATKDIELAPGEGKTPKDMMQEVDWDIKAFPHLHNMNGRNGKDEERSVRLTDQNYFIQRILNKDQRFSKSPTFKYAAVAYLEKKQLQRNINIAGTKGKKVDHADGNITYDLDDCYSVLDDIKNTPRYWKKVKYEMIAKLENLGAFQLFFTLSCADLRWEENFAAILRDKGLNLIYSVVPDENGHSVTRIEVEYMKDGMKRKQDLKQYIDMELKSSLHELIRGNVLLATRYFNQRVKKFFSTIVMGRNNPMNVEYYTYKVEFQERGAGHIHGTLWLNLDKLEELVVSDNGKLSCRFDGQNGTTINSDEQEHENRDVHPLLGIKSTFKKLKNDEKITQKEKESLKNFVDGFTTVSTNNATVGEDVSKKVLEVNKHSHTKACRKYGSKCRFLYPKYPFHRTIIAVPIEGMKNKEKKEKLKKYKATLKKVGEVLDNADIVDEIIERIGHSEWEPHEVYQVNKKKRILALLEKADVTLEDYEEALSYTDVGYKVVQERDLTEIFINSYNIEWIRAWDGNMDMQPCLDYHAVITYISDYFSKDDTGLMELIKTVIQENSSDSSKEQMRKVANIFLSHRQIGEAEAVYRLLPNMVLKNSNVACQWLSVGKRSEITKRWKLATKEELENEVGLIKIKDRDGYWIEQNDALSKYLRRPKELEMISASQFTKVYTTSGARYKKEEFEDDEENLEILEDDNAVETIMEYIITGDKIKVKLPKLLEICNPLPRETKFMRKRKKPAVLRYHKVNKENQFEQWMLKELMLYTPFREKDRDHYENNTADAYSQNAKWIQNVKSKVMEHLESVEEARLMVEASTKQVDFEIIGAELNAEKEQDQADCIDEGQSQHPDYLHMDTDGLDNHDKKDSLFKKVTLPSILDLRRDTQKLDEFQREILDRVIKYSRDIVKARRDGNTEPSPIYTMVHGGAGAGKSTVIHLLAKWSHHILSQSGDNEECPYVLKTAFTGTAASNIEGQTLHTSFSFNFDNKHYSLSDKKRDEKRAVFKNLKLLVIDEVSMVKADMLYQLDLKLQELKEMVGTPFGGVSIILFGDMLQLRPVLGAFPFEKPKNPEFHATFALDNRWEKFEVLNLEVNHRQGKDKEYAEILNRMRIGMMTDDDIEKLKTRVRPKGHSDLKEVDLHIVPIRKTCAKFNYEYLVSLKGPEIILKASHYHSTKKTFKPFIEGKEGAIGNTSFIDEIKVKIGAKIIIIHNIDTGDGLTNGQLGILTDIINTTDGKPDKLIVTLQKVDVGSENRKKFPNIARKYPNSVIIEKASINYSIRKKGGIVGSTATLIQFPIKLANAITAHKIQGQTIPKPLKVALDVKSIFEEAQGYVMFSRVQEMNQLYIIDEFDPNKIYPSAKALKELERMNRVAINNNLSPWQKEKSDTVKIMTFNCAGIKPHYQDIKCDSKLKKADMINLLETSLLSGDHDEDFPLMDYSQDFINIGMGKGIGTYFDSKKFVKDQDIQTEKFQANKFRHNDIDLICLYRSQIGNSNTFLQDLTKLIDIRRPTIIMGDFNSCYRENINNRLVQGLLNLGFKQLIHEPTHIQGRTIDHTYVLDPQEMLRVTIERYSPYYSDHDAICICLTMENAE